jgi:hypothetical protein
MRVQGLREWAEVIEVDGLVQLRLGDERDDNEDAYRITLTVDAATELAFRLIDAANAAAGPEPADPAEEETVPF